MAGKHLVHGGLVLGFNCVSHSLRAPVILTPRCCLSPSTSLQPTEFNTLLCSQLWGVSKNCLRRTTWDAKLPGISSTQSRSCLYYGSNEMFILAESTQRGFFVFCFFMFSQHLVLAARSPQHPAWHQGFKTFLKWQNVCAGVYFNISQWFRTGCFSWGCFCSVLLSQVEMLTNMNSPYWKLFFFLFTLETGHSNSCLWFSECLMPVRPLNGMLITNWSNMSAFSCHSVLAMGSEAYFSL